MKISMDNLRDEFHEEFMKFPETFLTKLRPVQARRVTEIKESVISEEVLKQKAVGSETSSMKRVGTSAPSTNWADPSNSNEDFSRAQI